MKFGTVMLTSFFAACALGIVVWVTRSQPISVTEAKGLGQQGNTPDRNNKNSGPQPKAVADEISFDFGHAIVGNEYSHIFTLKNEGEAPLTVEKGKSTCQCTVSNLEEGKTLEVSPGESVEITLTWRPKESDAWFSHSAAVKTNDLKSRTIKFEIHGQVVKRFDTMPSDIWTMPDIHDDKPTFFSGYLFSSALKDFQITGLKTTHPLLSAKHFKLSKLELSQYNKKCGFRIDLELKTGAAVGPFNESLSIATNVENATSYTVNVRSHRFGPMTIRPLQNVKKWAPIKMGFSMGDFPASEGRTSILHLYVKGLDGKDLEFRDVEVDPEYLQFSLTPDDSFSGNDSKRSVLTFKIPPGTPRASRVKGNSAQVHLKTNHPEVPEMNFLLHFISR